MVHVSTPRPSVGSALGQALGSLGGQQLGRQFANQQEEQQFQKNQGRQRQESQFQQDVLNRALTEAQKVYADQSLSPEQKEIGLYNALRAYPEVAKNLSHSLAEKQKASLPKAPPGGLSGQSPPPEVSNAVSQVLRDNPDASADELRLAMDKVGIPPAYSEPYTENRRKLEETRSKDLQRKVEYAQERNKPVFEERRKARRTLPIQTADLHAMEDAIKSEDLSFFSPDSLADIFHVEAFRTAKGAQLKTAVKNHFANSVSKFGAKPNQYIEQQVAQTFPQIGRSREANLTSLELLKFDHDLNREYIEASDRIEDMYQSKLGYVPETFDRDVDNFMKEYTENRQLVLEQRLRELHKIEKAGKSSGKGQKALTDEVMDRFLDEANNDAAKAADLARKAGYEF